MPEHLHYEDDDLFNQETHHEKSDVPIRPLFWFIGFVVVFAFVTHFVLYAMYNNFAERERKNRGPQLTAMDRPANVNVPQNQPLLQPFPATKEPPYRATPVIDLSDMRKREDQILHTYGWVDRNSGVVHVPIDVAKELAVQRLNGGGAQP